MTSKLKLENTKKPGNYLPSLALDYKIPPDLFSRNFIISEAIRQYKKEKGLVSAKILDIGGRNGKLSEFVDKSDELTLLDIRPGKEKNLIVGDATNMLDISDGEYDVVVSGDVFEHIPKEKRGLFIKESSRVSRGFTILAAPFEDQLVTEAEARANGYFKLLAHKDHEWLKEHLECGLPSEKEFIGSLREKGLYSTVTYSNNVDNWILTQAIVSSAFTLHAKQEMYEKFYEFYNMNLLELENPKDHFYRRVFFISSEKPFEFKLNYDYNSEKRAELLALGLRVIQEVNLHKINEKEANISSLEKDKNLALKELSAKKLALEAIENSRVWKARNFILGILGRKKR